MVLNFNGHFVDWELYLVFLVRIIKIFLIMDTLLLHKFI